MTDMRYAPALEIMNREAVRAVWEAPDRTRALEGAAAAYGADGSKVMQALPLAP